MTEISVTQQFVLLAAHNIRMNEHRDERVNPRSYRTTHALRQFGYLDELDRPNFAGLVAAGVDMDALHDEALGDILGPLTAVRAQRTVAALTSVQMFRDVFSGEPLYGAYLAHLHVIEAALHDRA